MSEYVIPAGVHLAHPELAPALAAVGVEQRSYAANGVLTHSFRDRLRGGRALHVVESDRSKTPVEVVGNTVLWLLIRETARQVCTAPALDATAPGDPAELGLAA